MIWRVKLLHLGSNRYFFFGYKGQEVVGELLVDFEKKKKKFVQGRSWNGYCQIPALGRDPDLGS